MKVRKLMIFTLACALLVLLGIQVSASGQEGLVGYWKFDGGSGTATSLSVSPTSFTIESGGTQTLTATLTSGGSSPNPLSDWSYRKPITINNTGGALTDYQISITLDTASLVSTGKMRSDSGDIRFTDSDGATLLSYWIESGVNTASTKIWAKVPTIPAGDKTIYMYYGNPPATSESNGPAVFDLFDDFNAETIDSSKWVAWTSGGGTIDPSGTTVKMGNPSSDGKAAIRSVNAFPFPVWLEAFVTQNNNIGGIGVGTSTDLSPHGMLRSGYNFRGYTIGDADQYLYRVDGSGNVSGIASNANSPNTNVLWRLEWNGGHQWATAQNGVLEANNTDVTTGNVYVKLGCEGGWWGSGTWITFDWARVRKYTSSEPGYTPGGEEEAAASSPLAGKTITWSTTSGSFSATSGTTDASGQVTVTYTAPTVTSQTSVTITASFAGDASYESSSGSSSGTVTVPSTGDLVGYWKFDEGSGSTASDASGYGDNGTLQNMDTSTCWVDGISGKALNFDGVDDYVEVPYSSLLDFNALTWSAWVRPDTTTATEGCGIVSKAWTVDYHGEWSGNIRPDAKVGFTTLTSSNRRDLAGNTTLSPGVWYHIAGTYDGSTMRIYVNGVEDGSVSQSGQLHLNMPLRVGRTGRVGFMDGVIDEVRAYNRALSAEEIGGIIEMRGSFELALSESEVAVRQGESWSMGVNLNPIGGFSGTVQLSVEGLPPGVQVSFDPNPVYQMGDASSVLTITVNSSPQQVKNTVTVVASGGGVTREASFMLYAFEDSWVGTVVVDRSPTYDDNTIEGTESGGISHSADAFAPLTADGYVYADTNAQIWAEAKAYATQLVHKEFMPEQSGPITVEARLRVRSFIALETDLLGVANGETSGHVYLNGERHIRLFESDWAFDAPFELLPYIGGILRIIKDTVDTEQDLIELITYVQDYSSFEERVVRYTWNVNGGQTYNIGGGVSSNVNAKIIAVGDATVVGYVDSIKVWRGTAPLIEYKFDEVSGNVAYDSSGLNLNASMTGGYWTSGLTSGALGRDSSSSVTSAYTSFNLEDLWRFDDMSFETWVKPTHAGPLIYIVSSNEQGYYSQFQFELGLTEDGKFYFEGDSTFMLGDDRFIVGGSYTANKEWYHIVGIYDSWWTPTLFGGYWSASYSLYADGMPVGSAYCSNSFSLYGYQTDLAIGPPRFYTWFGGLIEEVKLYPRALSSDEIVARYRAGPSL